MQVYCFDFDGVICDSAPETALSAWIGCAELWPEGGDAPAEPPAELRERFCRLRPVMHTGFEAIPLMRLIRDGQAGEDALMADFPRLRDELIAREGLSTAALQQRFGGIRDRLIENDPGAWLRWNRFYPGVEEMLAAATRKHVVTIITTKQERFVTLLFQHHGVEFPPERIFGLERGQSKPDILAALLEDPAMSGEPCHFIEDRLETLQDVLARPALAPVRLYLADWGYNTPAQRAAAARMARIQVVTLEAFRRLHGF
jgi:phosphoglycolate phosphatase-like HAD superfamily hydrolase